jgi:hypothetical protein
VQRAKSRKALLVRENKSQRHTSEKRASCESNRLFGGAPCPKAGKENLDGLVLCERHALEAKLEGQIECWGGMLFHTDLWSREARRRQREDIVGFLEVQRAEAMYARQLARTDLDRLRNRDTPLGTLASVEEALGRGPLKRDPPPLPAKAARPLSRGLRRR